jgi:hypothetical protein
VFGFGEVEAGRQHLAVLGQHDEGLPAEGFGFVAHMDHVALFGGAQFDEGGEGFFEGGEGGVDGLGWSAVRSREIRFWLMGWRVLGGERAKLERNSNGIRPCGTAKCRRADAFGIYGESHRARRGFPHNVDGPNFRPATATAR